MDEARRAALTEWLAAQLGGSVQLGAMRLLSGGAIQQNWAVDAETPDGPQRWVLRTDSDATLAVSHSRAEEHALLRAAFDAGVTVPEPLLLGADPGVIGRPFFVMRRVDGIAQGHRIVRNEALGGGREALAEAIGRELARIHAIRPPRDDLGFLGTPDADPARALIAALRARLDAQRTARPALEWGVRHLERTAPPPGEIALCHNDFRTGNIMVAESGVTAVLDWEFAGWGDPQADLGWFTARCWRFGNDAQEAGGIGSREAFYRGYEAAGGRADRARAPWWELAATLRWAVIAIDQAERHISGTERSLELALTGHIVPELELDILRMTEPAHA